ncbi:hydantoinase/oxoprolinase N-terminal domain-containing protein [Roseibium sp.]|uniref:hydantoinase/oxoprolinase N-terminal domain-containing protein n=1 Tax=Roseibium sp. TaxID=1936156 RepID=UPI003A97FC9E
MSVLAIDIGSEFVDLAFERDNTLKTMKRPVGSDDPAGAILSAIDDFCLSAGIPVPALSDIRIGSTGAINALLARRIGRIALVTTTGFADTLYLGRQNRRDLYDPIARLASPTFLVDRKDIHEIDGRFDAKGQEIEPLPESGAAELVRTPGFESYDAIAVCLLYSYLNPDHELRLKELIAKALPDVPVILSHEVDPNPREFERTVSTCLEACLRPMEARTIAALQTGLSQRGFTKNLQFANGTGRLLTPEIAKTRSSTLLISGPAAAARHAAWLSGASETPLALAVDIGSTTTDMTLIMEGAPTVTRQSEFAGVPVRQAMTDVHSLQLGGLACPILDGIGGIVFERPSETLSLSLRDCLAWLERIPVRAAPDTKLSLDTLGEGLGLSAAATAEAIVAAAEQQVASVLLKFSVKRNVDPSRAALVGMGGLGAVLGAGIAERLGITKILVPEAPAVAGALGMLGMGPNISERLRVGANALTLGQSGLADRLNALRNALPPLDDTRFTESLSVEMAATPFMHPFEVTLTRPSDDPQVLVSAFAAQYADRFGIAPPGSGHVFAMTLAHVPADLFTHRPEPTLPDTCSGMIASEGGTLWVPQGWGLSVVQGGYAMTRAEV